MEPFTKHTGVLAPMDRVNVDTDQIIPKNFLKSIARTGYGQNCFNDWRYREDGTPNPDFVLNKPEYQGASILVAGRNFGCGSSREYAPLALKLLGLGAIIAPSFARIFYRNALNLGIPLFEADLPMLADGEIVTLDRARGVIDTDNGRITLPAPPPWIREVWEAGGIVPFFREHGRFPGQGASGR